MSRRAILAALLAVPALLFAGTIAYVAVDGGETGPCVHDHPPEQVRRWWLEARERDLEAPGIVDARWVRAENCIRVTVKAPPVRATVERRLRTLGVPLEVVAFRVEDATGDGS